MDSNGNVAECSVNVQWADGGDAATAFAATGGSRQRVATDVAFFEESFYCNTEYAAVDSGYVSEIAPITPPLVRVGRLSGTLALAMGRARFILMGISPVRRPRGRVRDISPCVPPADESVGSSGDAAFTVGWSFYRLPTCDTTGGSMDIDGSTNVGVTFTTTGATAVEPSTGYWVGQDVPVPGVGVPSLTCSRIFDANTGVAELSMTAAPNVGDTRGHAYL